MVLALAFSLTRGVWAAAAVVLLTLAAVRRGRHGWVAVAGLGLLCLLLVGLGPGVRERAASAFDVAANVGRTQIWAANVDMVKARPVLGWGYGNYKRFRDPYYVPYPGADNTAHAHNNFLQVWVDTGLVGLAAFVYLFWAILERGLWTYRRLPATAEPLNSIVLGCVLAVLGFLVGGMTQYNFGDSEVAIVLWFTVGVTMRVHQLAGGQKVAAGAAGPSAAGAAST
jgi:O-antigen ligase